MDEPSQHRVVDWSAPWFASIRGEAGQIAATDDWRAALDQRAQETSLENARCLPLRFVAQEALRAGFNYESFIHEQGQIPTRDNLHDLFNGLVWLSFPKLKRQVNAIHCTELRRGQEVQGRGKVRDALTLLDENGVLVMVSDNETGDDFADGLRAHKWREVLYDGRNRFGSCVQVFSFGHGLMEQLVRPFKAITAHVWLSHAPPELFNEPFSTQQRWIDAKVADELALHYPASLTSARLSPLPVLGIPGWSTGQNEDFYNDSTVFRPKSRRRQ